MALSKCIWDVWGISSGNVLEFCISNHLGNCILCVQLLSKINMLERLRHFVRITYVFLLATVIPALYDSSAILNISP